MPATSEPRAPRRPQPRKRRDTDPSPSLNPNAMASPPDPSRVSPSIEEIMGIPVDMNEFLQPAHDSHGHSERHATSFLPGHFMEMAKVVESRRWPYRNYQDLVRHAIHRHLKWLGVLHPTPTVMGQVSAMLEVLKDEAFLADFHRVFDQAREIVAQHVSSHNTEMAADLVRRLWREIEDMSEGEWKDRYLREFEREFGAEMGEGEKDE